MLDFPLQYAVYNLDFVSNNEQFTQIGTANNRDSGSQEFSLIYANSTTTKYIYDFEYTSSYYSEMEAYKTIQITGGTDATNSTLIAWLQTNGTLTKTVVEETYTITAGTYKFNDTVGGEELSESFNFTSNGSSFTNILVELSPSLGICVGYDSSRVYASVSNGWSYNNSNYQTINITTEQTVSRELYVWFTENATIYIQAGTYNFKETISYFDWANEYGTENIEFVSNGTSYESMGDYDGDLDRLEYEIKGTGTSTSFAYNFNNNTWYNEAYRTIHLETPQTVNINFYNMWFVPNTLITFTIEGNSYQAENGMTWGEWVESSYNTAAFSVYSDNSLGVAGQYIANNRGKVFATDIIIANGTYTLEGGPGGGSN